MKPVINVLSEESNKLEYCEYYSYVEWRKTMQQQLDSGRLGSVTRPFLYYPSSSASAPAPSLE